MAANQGYSIVTGLDIGTSTWRRPYVVRGLGPHVTTCVKLSLTLLRRAMGASFLSKLQDWNENNR